MCKWGYKDKWMRNEKLENLQKKVFANYPSESQGAIQIIRHTVEGGGEGKTKCCMNFFAVLRT